MENFTSLHVLTRHTRLRTKLLIKQSGAPGCLQADLANRKREYIYVEFSKPYGISIHHYDLQFASTKYWWNFQNEQWLSIIAFSIIALYKVTRGAHYLLTWIQIN